jgi:hypothetical protein
VSTESQQPDSVATDATAQAVPGRRRFLQAGVGAGTGVILTLVSDPVLAGPAMCRAPSASLSATFSSHNHQQVTCQGVSPGYWMNHAWPAGASKKAKFGTLFDCSTGPLSAYYASATLWQLTTMTASFGPSDKDWYNIGRHFVAAYLNAISGKSSFLTVSELREMWHEYMLHGGHLGGYYQVNATVKWDGTAIVNYLKSTMS